MLAYQFIDISLIFVLAPIASKQEERKLHTARRFICFIEFAVVFFSQNVRHTWGCKNKLLVVSFT